MGAVYRAFDRERRSVVALKTLTHVDPIGIYQFKEEFRALTDLLHPNVVQLYELVGHGGSWFFTMELIDGATFLQWVHHGVPTSSPGEGPTSMVRRASSMAPTLDATALEMQTVPVPADFIHDVASEPRPGLPAARTTRAFATRFASSPRASSQSTPRASSTATSSLRT